MCTFTIRYIVNIYQVCIAKVKVAGEGQMEYLLGILVSGA